MNVTRVDFENSNHIGCYAKLTNSYCLVAISENPTFYSVFDEQLSNYIPVVQTSIFNSILVGTLTAGNKNGLLVPTTATDQEILHIRNSLPDSIIIRRIEEKLSALGNVIACNDHIALIHPELDRESEYIIEDVLGVEVYRYSIAKNPIVGTYCIFNNYAGVTCPDIKTEELDEISKLLQIPLTICTVNRGSPMVGSGIVMNDFSIFCGSATSGPEYSVISNLINIPQDIQQSYPSNDKSKFMLYS